MRARIADAWEDWGWIVAVDVAVWVTIASTLEQGSTSLTETVIVANLATGTVNVLLWAVETLRY